MSYLLALLAAARANNPERQEGATLRFSTLSRLVVLIPAHNEDAGIEDTLRSIAACGYPSELRRTIVIADNCSDRTAARSEALGVEVWERNDSAKRGKGHALAWALDLLKSEDDPFHAVVMIDADCLASPNLLSAIDVRLRGGANAVQVNYLAANPTASPASALRFGGFALMNTVRFSGKQRLGLSCGLVGTGMGFTRELLDREPWSATGLVEDAEYHMRLVLSGEKAHFVQEAWVSSAVPTSLARGADQHARWEQGKLQLVRSWSPRLVAAGLARHDIVRLHAGLEYLVPPQSLISAGSIGSVLAGLLLGSRRLVLLSSGTLAAQLTFVLAGFRLAGVPREVYQALLVAPALIGRKLALYARLLQRRGPTSWVRTERESPVTVIREP